MENTGDTSVPPGGPGLLAGPCLAVVTGASRGLGRAIARHLQRHLPADSALLLTARDTRLLHETRDQLLSERTAAPAAAGCRGVRVLCVTADLSSSDESQLAGIVSAAEQAADATATAVTTTTAAADATAATDANATAAKQSDRPLYWVLLVHNAGSVGDVSLLAHQHVSLAALDDFYRLSVTSTVALTSRLVQALRGRCSGRLTVLNISSLCALQPFVSMSQYCSAKAARDAYFAVLAAETEATDTTDASGTLCEERQCQLDVLSYAPGPLITDMSRQVAECSASAAMRRQFVDGRVSGFLTCEQSVERLWQILLSGRYRSGQHVDYFDSDY